jgi:enoyl-CoA hydratase/carnithine racemase
MTAEEGASWGFFNRLVAVEELRPQVLALATELARGPTFAHAMTKQMLHKEWNLDVESAIEAEAQAQAECMRTEDFQRAYRAFVAKEPPTFKGN